MASAVKGNVGLIQPEALSIGHGMKGDLPAKPLAQHSFTAVNGPVLTAAGSGMVRMRMGDQCPWNWPQRINPGICCRAIQTFRSSFDQAPLLIAVASLKAP